MAWASLGHAESLTLTPTDDSYIRASQGNQGNNNLVLVGDTANSADFLRTALAFDLSAPELTNATIIGVFLTLTINDRDTASGSSANVLQAVDLLSLSASFTNNGVTWFSRDGSNNWASPRGGFCAVLADVNADAGTVNGGDTLVFSISALTASVESAVGGSIYLLTKLAVEDADRSVFRFASSNLSNTSYHRRLTIAYEPFVNDPDLRQDLATVDWNLAFGVLSGDPPVSATRTLRVTNKGPETPITIESGGLSGGGGVFAIDDVAVNGSGGQSQPFTLQVGDSLALTVSATADTVPMQADATLTLTTSDATQDRVFPASVSFLLPESAIPHPAIPGTPASAAYQVRIDGVPVPVNEQSYFHFDTAFCSMDEPTMVEVEFFGAFSYASIHPLRHGNGPEIDGNKISFPLLKPLKLVVKANGALPLAICVETELFKNISFRNIDVLAYAGAAIYADHSDWATCRDIRFENLFIEPESGKRGARAIDIYIAKTRYSNDTGFRDARGHYDGLEFINVTAPAETIRLRGYDADHQIENVLFCNCRIGGKPVKSLEDVQIDEFVSGVNFEITE